MISRSSVYFTRSRTFHAFDSGRHRGRSAQRFEDAAEVVVREVDRVLMRVILDLL